MLSFLNDRQSNQSPPIWEQLVRYALILGLTVVLFGSLYLGIKFLE
jgi:hypothetical protein